MPSTQTSGWEQSAGEGVFILQRRCVSRTIFFQEGVFTGAPYPRAVAVEAGGRDSSGWPCSGGRPQSLTPPPPLFLSLWSAVREEKQRKGVSSSTYTTVGVDAQGAWTFIHGGGGGEMGNTSPTFEGGGMTCTNIYPHTHILVFGVNRGPWKIHTNNRRTRTRMSDIVRGIVDFAHLTWRTTICVWNLIDEPWTYWVHVIFMLYLAHSHMNACRISNH